MKHIATAITMAILLASAGYALPLGGKVVDEEGRPIVGASVVTNLDGVGAATDDRGEFSLSTREGITRVTVSAVGYRARQFRTDDLPPTIKLEPMFIRGEDILISAGRAEPGLSPVAFDNISEGEIERDYMVSELPLLLGATPNLYAFSYSGSGLGATEYRIRGFDSKRVSVYIDGVPLNDPEDHTTYFVDIPDFAAEVNDVQVQRGVGMSMYGDASFGGSVNIASAGLVRPRKVTVTSGYGGFFEDGKQIGDMRKQSVEYSSGLIDGRWLLSGRYSKQYSDGYREQSWFDGWAYSFSLSRIDPNMTTTLNIYGGPIKYHMAWYGIDRETMKSNRRANWSSYDNETDNFNQPHYQLHHRYRLSDNLSLKNTLYYIRGKGFYEQFKSNRKYSEYNIPLDAVADGSPRGDLVRQKWVTKHQYGWNPRLDWTHPNGKASFGGAFYYFESEHWGQVVWAEKLTSALDPRHKYYEYFGEKYFASVFAHEYYHLNDKLALMGDLQLKYLKYKFDQTRMGPFEGYKYNLDWLFLSPRIGLNYALKPETNAYTSFSVSSREPNDDNIYDAEDPGKVPQIQPLHRVSSGDPTVENERVYDFELGLSHRETSYRLGLNFFWMQFNNENVFEGGFDSLGREITINIDRAVHAGFELTGSVKPVNRLMVDGNFALNFNRISEYDTTLSYTVDSIYIDPVTQETVVVESTESAVIDYDGKTPPLFPAYLGNLNVDYQHHWYRVTWRARMVGRQYVELFNDEELSIDPYLTSSVTASFIWQDFLETGRLTLSLNIDNLFDNEYEVSGYGGNWASRDQGEPVRVNSWAEYFVGPERSFYAQLRLELF